jgi:hypothetical protein
LNYYGGSSLKEKFSGIGFFMGWSKRLGRAREEREKSFSVEGESGERTNNKKNLQDATMSSQI